LNEAFAKFGLDLTLSIVPVAPGREHRAISVMSSGSLIGADLNCPPGQRTTCPLTLELSGKEVRQGPTRITSAGRPVPARCTGFSAPQRTTTSWPLVNTCPAGMNMRSG
jgi:hypothetical protein